MKSVLKGLCGRGGRMGGWANTGVPKLCDHLRHSSPLSVQELFYCMNSLPWYDVA